MRLNIKYILFISFVLNISFFLLAKSYANSGNWSINEYSKARLISSVKSYNNNNNDKLLIGLEFKLKPNWKIYWKYPGDAGLPTQIKFKNAGEDLESIIHWPFPEELIEEGNLISRVYYDEVILPITLLVKKSSKNIILNGQLNYQVCDKICIPISTEVNLQIPKGEVHPSIFQSRIKEYIDKVPVRAEKIGIKNKKVRLINNKRIVVSIKPTSKIKDKNKILALVTGPDHIAYKNGGYNYNNKNNTLSIYVDTIYTKKDIENIKKNNLNINVRIDNNFFYWDSLLTRDTKEIEYKKIFVILFLAFIGGFILNFMPCVLPVLGIKIASLIKQSSSSSLKIKISCLSITLGMVFTFMIFSLLAIILRNMGVQLGWGMQFQYPIFLIILIIILLLFALNLLGLMAIRIPRPINNFVNHKFFSKEKSYLIKDFSTGMLTTILATPCTAPIVGTVVSFALMSNDILIFSIFSVMGIGMAIPYLLFIINPSLIKLLPSPGKWMNKFKYFLAILLICTTFWLLDILYSHYKKEDLINNNSKWIEFNPESIPLILKENKMVFLDITAKWCISCKVNKLLVLKDDDVQDFFNNNNIILMRGDWTLPNPKINDFLFKHGRSGIPFNAIFTNSKSKVIVLPELLSKEKLLNILKENYK